MKTIRNYILTFLALCAFSFNARAGVVNELVHSFTGLPFSPGTGTLVLAPDGYFWGTTEGRGYPGGQAIYKVKADGTSWTTVQTISNGGDADSGLVNDGNGFVWGTGASVYKVEVATGLITTVAEFTDGAYSFAGLVSDGNGFFWGTTVLGGNGNGSIFKVNIVTGALTTVLAFTGTEAPNKGSYVVAGLANGEAGFLWGTTQGGGVNDIGTVFKVNISTGVLTTLVEFTRNGVTNKGGLPCAGLVSDGSGFFWGTTIYGGANDLGTVYNVNAATGVLTTVANFDSAPSVAGLVSDGNGFFWGTTTPRSPYDGRGIGFGSVFKVNATTGAFTTVVSFDVFEDGKYQFPLAGLVNDGNGYLWGTTSEGGQRGAGSVFKVNIATGAMLTVAQFTSSAGIFANPGLVSDASGYLWGTTQLGGTDGYGTVFKTNAMTGATETVIEFTNNGASNKGQYPSVGLVSDGIGFLWGTAQGGSGGGFGTVFKVDVSSGALTTVHQFTGGSDGASPNSRLVRDGSGFIWGKTPGPAFFKIDSSTGVFTTELAFTSASPEPDVILYSDGNQYATTLDGGPGFGGTVYRLRYFGPESTTQVATLVTVTGATVHGLVNPRGSASAVSVQYGTSSTLVGGTTVSIGTSTAGTSAELFSHALTGLQPGTIYYYRIGGTNADEPTLQQGEILSFTTLPNTPPTVTLLGTSPLTIGTAASYTDAGATGADAEDGVLTPVVTANTVVPGVAGSYSVTWTATDAFGATGFATRTVVVTAPTGPTHTNLFTKGGAVPGAGVDTRIAAGAKWTGFGISAINDDGQVAFIGKWGAVATPGVLAQTGTGIFRDATLLVKVGETTPLSGVLWKTFKDPVLGQNGDVAFLATVGGTGVTAANDSVLAKVTGSTVTLHLQEGGQPPNAPVGAQWNAVVSLAVAGDAAAPVFTATLINKIANPGGLALPGPGGITSVNDLGCWAVDSTGTLRGLFREGDTINGKTLKMFSVLGSTVGSPGAARAFNANGVVTWLATFSDNTTSVMTTQVP